MPVGWCVRIACSRASYVGVSLPSAMITRPVFGAEASAMANDPLGRSAVMPHFVIDGNSACMAPSAHDPLVSRSRRSASSMATS